MKTFLTTTIALALGVLAAAELHQGYNYQAHQSIYPVHNGQQQQQPLIMQILAGPIQPQSAPLLHHNSILPPSPQYLPVQQQQHQQQQHHQQQQLQLQLPQYAQQLQLPSLGMSLPMPLGFPGSVRAPSRRYRPRVKIAKKPVITKNFFIHSAPEETEEDIQEELAQLQQQPRKHYNVLFVKTPSQTSRTAALSLAKALKEEKTVVYVLSKKTSASDLQEAIQDAPQHLNKPEVFFIKYRTPEEAANAQRQIQTQYDTLGGTSTITDEGVAPITSVVGSLDPEEEEGEDESQSQSQEEGQLSLQSPLQSTQSQQFNEQLAQSVNNQYLPPSARL